MNNYSVKTLMVTLPEQPITGLIMVTLSNNAIPIGIEVRPVSFPGGLLLHHLIPCDEQGNIIEEEILPSDYETAWFELFRVFSERMEQENTDLMDSIMKAILMEKEEEEKQRKGE